MAIDHVRAHDEHLAERYLLQEMTADEAEAFELHFFECEECATAVEAGQILQANGRAVMAEGWSPAAERSLWRSLVNWWKTPMAFIPVPAALLLGAIALYQGTVVIPGLHQARILPAFQLTGASRGEATQVGIQKGVPFFSISADLPPDTQFPRYICELTPSGGEGGAAVFRLTAPAPPPGQAITMMVPAAEVHAGQYQLTVFGAGSDGQQREKISTLSFDFRVMQ
jgi:hypothetical protein